MIGAVFEIKCQQLRPCAPKKYSDDDGWVGTGMEKDYDGMVRDVGNGA
jgi:hypothetical protein